MLRPEVAAKYRLSDAGHTRIYVTRLGYEVDLTQLSLEEADALVAGGFEWLVALPVDDEVPTNEAGLAADTTRPARAKRKKHT